MQCLAVTSSVEELNLNILRCTACCSGDCRSYHCPLCPPYLFKPTKKCKVKLHLRTHWKCRIQTVDDASARYREKGLFSVTCRLPHEHISGTHFHCVYCCRPIRRKADAIKHIEKCSRNNGPNRSNVNEHVESSHHAEDQAVDHDYCSSRNIGPNRSNVNEHVESSHHAEDQAVDHDYCSSRNNGPNRSNVNEHVESSHHAQDQAVDHDYCRLSSDVIPTRLKAKCCFCGGLYSKKYIRQHEKIHKDNQHDIGMSRHHHCVIVNPTEGLYTASKRLSGPYFPVHIKKITSGPDATSVCEDDHCRQQKEAANRGGNLAYDCCHIRSIQYAEPGRDINLLPSSLAELVNGKYLTTERSEEATNLQAIACENGVPLVVYLPPPSHVEQQHLYLSVFTENIRYHSRLHRTIVSFHKPSKTMSCRCCRQKRLCVHKVTAKWFLFQEMPYLIAKEFESDVEEDVNCFISGPESEEEMQEQPLTPTYPPTDKKVLQMMISYLKEEKKYPPDVSGDSESDLLFANPVQLQPSEVRCARCSGSLSEGQLVTQKGKIIFMKKIIKRMSQKKELRV